MIANKTAKHQSSNDKDLSHYTAFHNEKKNNIYVVSFENLNIKKCETAVTQ